MDIDFGHKKRGEKPSKLVRAFFKLNHNKVSCRVRDIVNFKELVHSIWIADHDPHDRRISRILNIQRKHFNTVLIK